MRNNTQRQETVQRLDVKILKPVAQYSRQDIEARPIPMTHKASPLTRQWHEGATAEATLHSQWISWPDKMQASVA